MRSLSNLKILSDEKREMQLYIKIADAALEPGEELFYEKYRPITDRVYVEKVVPIWKDSQKDDKEKRGM